MGAEGSTEAQMCTALQSCGFGELVSPGYNAGSLKKKVLTLRAAGQAIPPEILQHIDITQTKSLEVQVSG